MYAESFKKSQPPPHSNFLSGVKWSPDGVCFLTVADDNYLRIYDIPPSLADENTNNNNINPNQQEEQQQHQKKKNQEEDSFSPSLRVNAGELIYDYNWYPWSSATDPATCCFVITTRDHPVHLYDAVSGQLRCSYRPYNANDELDQAHGICFSPDGTKIFAGGRDSAIYIFDVSRPGRDHDTLFTNPKKKDKKRSHGEISESGQPGIISCIACPKDTSGLMAAGSYSGVTGLYDYRSPMQQLALLEGNTKSGITHLKFSPCGTYLYTGARIDCFIYCWDARNMSGPVYTLERNVKGTAQRFYFDIEPCGRHLASGGQDGSVKFWDLRDGSEVRNFRVAEDDAVNGCEFHPSLPIVATTTGHRRLYCERIENSDGSRDEDGEEESENGSEEGCIQSGGCGGRGKGEVEGQKNVKFNRTRQRPVLKRDENSLCLWKLGMRTCQVV